MFQICDDCHRRYDDEFSNTMCPHYPLGTSPETYCRKHDLFRPCSGCAVIEEREGKSGAWMLAAIVVLVLFWIGVLWYAHSKGWLPWQ